MDLTTVLIGILLIAVVLTVASYFLGRPAVPAPANSLLWLVVAVLVILVILWMFGVVHP